MRNMKVRDIMTRGVIFVRLEDSVREVARSLSQNKIHAVAVTAQGGMTMGIISEIDVIGHIDKDIDRLTAKDIMTSHVETITPSASLSEATKVMRKWCHHRLLIMGELPRNEVAVGILSASDIVVEMARKLFR